MYRAKILSCFPHFRWVHFQVRCLSTWISYLKFSNIHLNRVLECREKNEAVYWKALTSIRSHWPERVSNALIKLSYIFREIVCIPVPSWGLPPLIGTSSPHDEFLQLDLISSIAGDLELCPTPKEGISQSLTKIAKYLEDHLWRNMKVFSINPILETLKKNIYL